MKDGDGARFGAGHVADAATAATSAEVLGGAVAVVVEFLADADQMQRTGFHAQSASFAFIDIDLEQASVLFHGVHMLLSDWTPLLERSRSAGSGGQRTRIVAAKFTQTREIVGFAEGCRCDGCHLVGDPKYRSAGAGTGQKDMLQGESEKAMSELQLDPKRTAIVVIDLQKGIVGRAGTPNATASVVANTVRLLNQARQVGAKPVLVHVGGAADGSDRLKPIADQPMRAGGALPPDWTELIPELDQQPGDVVILKRQWGAFYGTDLDLQLRRRGIDTIVLCGIATEIGVESTARDAFERGYHLLFAADAMTGTSAEGHANSVERIFPRMGRVRTTEEILLALKA